MKATSWASRIYVSSILSLLLLALIPGLQLAAQDDDPAAPDAEDPQLELLQDRNAILEERIKLAENQLKLLQAQFPGAEVEPLSGATTLEGEVPIESQVMAYRALAATAKEIADDVLAIDGLGRGPIVIFDETELAAIVRYQAFLHQLALLEGEFDRLIREAESLPSTAPELLRRRQAEPFAESFLLPALVTGILTSVADVAALFRTDVTLKTTALTIDDVALISEVASQLPTLDVYHPALYPPNLLELGSADASGLEQMIQRLDRKSNDVTRDHLPKVKKLKAELDKLVAEPSRLQSEIQQLKEKLKTAKEPERAKIQKKIAENEQQLPEAKEKAQKAKDELPRITALATALSQVQALYSALRTTLLAPGADGGADKLVLLLRAESLRTLMAMPSTHTILLKILAAAGSTRATKNLFTGGSLSHSGGAIVTYAVFDQGGKMVKSGVKGSRSGPVRFKEAEKLRRITQ